MKTITIFGGSGRTGKLAVREALDRGFRVRVLARNPSKMELVHENLEVIKGDVRLFADVQKAMLGSEAVLSVLGYVKDSKPGFQTEAMENIVECMSCERIHRLIALTGAGVPFDEDQATIGSSLLTLLVKSIAPARYSDGVDQCRLITLSTLNWTIVRAPILTNEKAKQSYQTGNLKLGFFSRISRADVAEFMISQVLSSQFENSAPFIAY